jgi:hypothetical protein
MDGFNEKKWFVYLGDHHEGPFSLAEIQAKIAQSQVSTANYVWAEGMTDWKPMTAVPEFEALLNTEAQAAAESSPTIDSSPSIEFVQPQEPSIEIPQPSRAEITPAPAGEAPPASSTHTATATALEPADEPLSPAVPANEMTYKVDLTQSSGVEVEAPAPAPVAKARAPRKPPSSGFKWVVVLLLIAALGGAIATGTLDPVLQSPAVKAAQQTLKDFAQPHLLTLSDKVPAIRKWVSPIPALDDVAPEEYEDLKQAASQKIEEGPKLAVAVSTADLFAPTFYIASNLPDGAVIDVYVEGVPDTLLNQLSFSGRTQATIDKKLGKSGPVRFADGKPLPRGQYIVYATEGAQQPDAVNALLGGVPPVSAQLPPTLPVGLRLLASKTVFLGGAKDATYESRLKEFHDKLRDKASTELAELKQLSATIEQQLSNTSAKYSQLRKGAGKPTAAARKGWSDFHGQWAKFEAQLRESYDKWTEQALATDYFYGSLYTLAKSAGDAVAKLHQLQSDFFAGKVDPKTFDIQRGSAVSIAEGAVIALKTKISQAENLAPTPNGMPRREGL